MKIMKNTELDSEEELQEDSDEEEEKSADLNKIMLRGKTIKLKLGKDSDISSDSSSSLSSNSEETAS